ncbi:MAG: hypothetical protein LBS68_00600 [Puniceicoccales bacterium]|jgi:tetratricopeptide (TPR) repeat protein|nr:hypothetical protein [Puniceicoccales bacterium]
MVDMDKNEQKLLWRQNLELLMDRIKPIMEEIKKNGTFQSGIGISDKEMVAAFFLGEQFYKQKKYDRAMIIFQGLHLLDPTNKDYARAIAATMQMCGNYSEAGIQFLFTYFFHPEDLGMALSSCRCMVEVGNITQAYFILNSIVEAKRYPLDAKNRDHLKDCKAILQYLEKLVNEEMKKSEIEQKKSTSGESALPEAKK